MYLIDGTPVEGMKALHPVAILATNAQASLAARGPYASECVKNFLRRRSDRGTEDIMTTVCISLRCLRSAEDTGSGNRKNAVIFFWIL